jgi:hypothetical protein
MGIEKLCCNKLCYSLSEFCLATDPLFFFLPNLLLLPLDPASLLTIGIKFHPPTTFRARAGHPRLLHPPLEASQSNESQHQAARSTSASLSRSRRSTPPSPPSSSSSQSSTPSIERPNRPPHRSLESYKSTRRPHHHPPASTPMAPLKII